MLARYPAPFAAYVIGVRERDLWPSGQSPRGFDGSRAFPRNLPGGN